MNEVPATGSGCSHCRSDRFWVAGQIVHETGCPAHGRLRKRLATAEHLLFAHPDLVELDLASAYWNPDLYA